MLTLLVGGVRSGKSSLAVRMGERQPAPVTFIATAEPFDADLAARVERHRAERPERWNTVECPVTLGQAVRDAPVDHFVIVDCLTVWMANLFVHVTEVEAIQRSVHDLLAALSSRTGPTVVVSNEVGMGIHPETSMGRDYRDDLGRVNQQVAGVADVTLLMVAGRALRLHDPWELLS
jgi:adenosylcobinamide kinase / adenosylcobinamide-phosphate guanylyltransferase